MAGLRIDFNGSRMLFDNDVVTERKTEARPLAGGFCGEKRIEHLFLHLGWNSRAVVVNFDFDTLTQIFGQNGERRFIVGPLASDFRFVAA